ncbi:MAG: helix-turn-helix domain-containing protein, partial [Candidatus Hodarchaeota archaeon]
MSGQDAGSMTLKATKDFMKKFDLPKDESVVYLAILGIGQVSSGEISLYTGLSVKKTEDTLVTLKEKGLIGHVEGRVDTYFARPPYEGFAQDLTEFAQKLKTFEDTVSNTSKEGKSAISKSEKAIKKTISKSISEFQQATTEGWDNVKNDITDQLTTSSQEIATKKEAATAAIEQELAAFGEESRNAIQTLQIDLTTGTQDMVTKLQESLTSVIAHSEENLASLNEKTVADLNSHAKSIETTLSTFGENASDTLEKLKETSNQSGIEYTTTLEETIKNEITNHQEGMES